MGAIPVRPAIYKYGNLLYNIHMPSNNKEYQKRASRKHYLANKDKVKARAKARTAAMTAYVKELKENTPCADCNTKYPYYVMDFDHLPGYEKAGLMATLVLMGSWSKMLAEIEKCELVCANCHRERTHSRLILI